MMKKKQLSLQLLALLMTAFVHAQTVSSIESSTYAEPLVSFEIKETGIVKKDVEKKEEKIPDQNCLQFTPPEGWMIADVKILPERVQMMAVGKGPSPFPPSLNLSSESYKGNLKQYLKTVKEMNASQGYVWKDLGTIQTQAGKGDLSQVDTQTTWGIVRLMHVILVKNGRVTILTASALKDEFSLFYQDFFASMRSLKSCDAPDTLKK